MKRRVARSFAAWLVAIAAMTGAPPRMGRVATAATPVRIGKGPYLTGLSDKGVSVRFELDEAAPVTLEVARDGEKAPAVRVFETRDVSNPRVIAADGLESATGYSYVLRSRGAAIGTGRFKTAPRPDSGATLTFLVYGDDRTDTASHTAVVHAMAQVPSDFLVHTGDLVETGGSAQDWQTFFDVEGPLLRDRALFAAVGNHDLFDDRTASNFSRFFGFPRPGGAPRPYGTVRLGAVRFFFLNAMHDWGSGEEREWIEGSLAGADGEADLVWRIVVLHHGPWAAGPHGPHAGLVDARMPELFAAHKVDLLLAGHDHLYERGDGGAIKYIVSGGAGAPLYPVAQKLSTTRRAESIHHFVEVAAGPDAIKIVARRTDGSSFDVCGFRKDSPWDCDLQPGSQGLAGSAPGPTPPEVLPTSPPPPPSTRRGCARSARSASGSAGSSAPPALFALAFVAGSAARRRGRRG